MSDLKRFHGLYRARGYGLLSVSLQSKLVAIAVNIKRIAAIATSIFCIFIEEFMNFNQKSFFLLILK